MDPRGSPLDIVAASLRDAGMWAWSVLGPVYIILILVLVVMGAWVSARFGSED